MLLAFLIPSLQDQWDRYQAREVIQEYAEMGDRFLGEENYRMAEQAYAKAMELSEQKRLDIETKRLRARVMQMTEVTWWGDSVPNDLEEVDFQFLLHMRPDDPASRADVLNAYGLFLAGSGRAKEALSVYAEALELDPANAATWIDQGDLFDALGRPQDAGRAYRRAISINPELVEAHYNLGLLLLQQDSAEAGKRELLNAARLAPSDTAIATRLEELRGDTIP
jgi:tetratricopeptide (TPR) repeat protein